MRGDMVKDGSKVVDGTSDAMSIVLMMNWMIPRCPGIHSPYIHEFPRICHLGDFQSKWQIT